MWDVVNQVIIRRFNHGKGKHNLQCLFCLLLSFAQEGVFYSLGSVKSYVVVNYPSIWPMWYLVADALE